MDSSGNINIKSPATSIHPTDISQNRISFATNLATLQNYANTLTTSIDLSSVFLSPTSAPLGEIKFYDTGYQCKLDASYFKSPANLTADLQPAYTKFSANHTDLSGDALWSRFLQETTVPRYNLLDTKSNPDPSKPGILYSATNDLNRLTTRPTLESDGRCIPVTAKLVDISGKTTVDTKYMATVDTKNINPSVREGFSPLNSFKGTKSRLSYELKDFVDRHPTINFREMDTIQQFFLFSTATLGLYLLFQGLYTKR